MDAVRPAERTNLTDPDPARAASFHMQSEPARVCCGMHYENFFWAMVLMVFIAIGGGAALSGVRDIIHALCACALLALLQGFASHAAARAAGQYADAALLGIAAFMFTLVISVAAMLAARRLLRACRLHGKGPSPR